MHIEDRLISLIDLVDWLSSGYREEVVFCLLPSFFACFLLALIACIMCTLLCSLQALKTH